jgi:hypothetical protein
MASHLVMAFPPQKLQTQHLAQCTEAIVCTSSFLFLYLMKMASLFGENP